MKVVKQNFYITQNEFQQRPERFCCFLVLFLTPTEETRQYQIPNTLQLDGLNFKNEEIMRENFFFALLTYFVSAVFVGVWLGLVINIIKMVSF